MNEISKTPPVSLPKRAGSASPATGVPVNGIQPDRGVVGLLRQWKVPAAPALLAAGCIAITAVLVLAALLA